MPDDAVSSVYSIYQRHVREQLAAVRLHPAMFTAYSDYRGLHRLVDIALDTGVVEAEAGRCGQVRVTLAADGSITVEHDGRGWEPVADPHTGLSALDRALTTLPSERRLRSATWLPVITALSTWLLVEMEQAGTHYRQRYQAGVPQAPPEAIGSASGQKVRLTFLPDPGILDGACRYEALAQRLTELAHLHSGLRLTVRDERYETPYEHSAAFADGLLALLQARNPDSHPLTAPISVAGEYDTGTVAAVLRYCRRSEPSIACYANDEAMPRGGTPLDGLLAGVARAINRMGRAAGLLGDDAEPLCRHDVTAGLEAVLSVRLERIAYGDSAGTSVANPEMRTQVLRLVERQLTAYCAARPREAQAAVRHCLERCEFLDRHRWDD